jgi:NADH-quinone oxidoreductase subunit C
VSDTEPTEALDDADSEPDTSEVERRYGAVVSDSRGQTVVHPTADRWLEVATAARDDGFDQLVDLTAVDYLIHSGSRDLPDGVEAERFEVVAMLLSHDRRERLRMRVQVPADAPTVASLFDLWPGAEALEREVLDMFGISFEDHPDHTRILMPEDWEGHPLRKDYEIGTIPVQFKAASNIR